MTEPVTTWERRAPTFPRTPGEVARSLGPWVGIWAALMLLQLILVVAVEDMTVQRLTLDARTVFRRNGNTTHIDGLFSVLTLLSTAVGIGAAVLTATLSHLRREDRMFALAISALFTLLALQEQLKLHEILAVEGATDEAGVLLVFVAVAGWIGVKWPQRVGRVWPLIVVGGGAQMIAQLLNVFAAEGHVEEWLELLAGVMFAGIAISLNRETVIEAMERRRPLQEDVSRPRSP